MDDAGKIDDPTALTFDEIGPERIFHYYGAAAGLRAVVVIDTTRFGLSAGGVRMAADLSLWEMVRLARAMSFKFAMLELPCGGAKAGIWLNPSDPAWPGVMRAFLHATRSLIERREYLPGADMGTSAADFSEIYPEGQNLGDSEFEGMPLEDQLTGYGVVVASGAACERLGIPLRGARVALEGFGKVGAGAAKYFDREGARLVAVSTVHGTLEDSAGLDVGELLALRKSYGDEALRHYRGGRALAPRERLFNVPAEVLVPGARPDSIHMENVDDVAARLVVPAANIPYAADVPARLQARGVVALPDFVSNAGGVLAGLVGMREGGAEEAFAVVRERVAHNIDLVLEAAKDQRRSAYEAALAIAMRRLTAA